MPLQQHEPSVFRGTINDSPWATMEEHKEAEGNNNNTTRNNGNGNGNGNDGASSRESCFACCCCCCCCPMISVIGKLFLFLDTCLGLTLMAYAVWLSQTSTRTDTTTNSTVQRTMIISFSCGALFCFRSLAEITTALAFYYNIEDARTTTCGQRCGLMSAACLSLLLALTYMVLGIVALIKQDKLSHLQYQSLHIPETVMKFVVHHVKWIWITFFILAALECGRWQLYQWQRREDDDDDEDQVNAIRRNGDVPWWWSSSPRRAVRHTDLTTSLLQQRNHRHADQHFGEPDWMRVRNGDGPENNNVVPRRPPPRRAFLFGSWFRPFGASSGRRRGSTGPRDDGSVDFASVQEEWATRSEEDPFWWSRDEDHNNNSNGGGDDDADTSTLQPPSGLAEGTSSSAERQVDLSWAGQDTPSSP